MLRYTPIALRKGMPRPANKLFFAPYTRVPQARKPHQGGQQHFQSIMLARANAAAQQQNAGADRSEMSNTRSVVELRSPLSGFADNRVSDVELPSDEFKTQRAYNERLEVERMPTTAQFIPSAEAALVAPTSISTNEAFTNQYGYSLVKKVEDFPAPESPYSQLDLWAEQPKYPAGTYFLYLVARRRNAYAVIYDGAGKRVHQTYSVGNRGLKDSDKGYKADGSAANAHIVTSQYLNDALPKIYDAEIAAGRMKPGEKKKIDLVVRVLGFYNARAGGVRAVTDRQDVFQVRYFEDITPFPLNGPRMPKRQQAN